MCECESVKTMIAKVCFFVCLLKCAHSWGRGDLEKFGPLRLALNSKYIKCNHDRNLDLDVSQVDIYFYDFAQNTTEIYAINYAAHAILSDKKLDRKRKFILFVGGYKSQIKKKGEEQVRQAYKNYPNSYLIIPDHSVYTNNNAGSKTGYERSVRHVHYIGKALGTMLAELNAGGVSRESIHCVGHSLGAQMLAHTGETFLNLTGAKIPRITALDPAGPCFSKSLINEQVRSGVADYVEVYHCNSGGFGTSSILGDVDFIVNKKGETQPQCNTPIIPGFIDSPKAATCNHRACIDVWTASVKNPALFPAYRCDSYKSFKSDKCSRNDMTLAGDGNPGTSTGVFYLSTKNCDLSKINRYVTYCKGTYVSMDKLLALSVLLFTIAAQRRCQTE